MNNRLRGLGQWSSNDHIHFDDDHHWIRWWCFFITKWTHDDRLWWSHLLQVAKTNKYFHFHPPLKSKLQHVLSPSQFDLVLFCKIEYARQTHVEFWKWGVSGAHEMRDYHIILHCLFRTQQNWQHSNSYSVEEFLVYFVRIVQLLKNMLNVSFGPFL